MGEGVDFGFFFGVGWDAAFLLISTGPRKGSIASSNCMTGRRGIGKVKGMKLTETS